MTLADQIIEHGPFEPGAVIPFTLADLLTSATEVNALRDELLELRRLRTAAEARERIVVDAMAFGEGVLDLTCDRCGWYADLGSQPQRFAELLRRADQHGEECHG